jgi:hypothetical protein
MDIQANSVTFEDSDISEASAIAHILSLKSELFSIYEDYTGLEQEPPLNQWFVDTFRHYPYEIRARLQNLYGQYTKYMNILGAINVNQNLR